jgi:hypothetical protein
MGRISNHFDKTLPLFSVCDARENLREIQAVSGRCHHAD